MKHIKAKQLLLAFALSTMAISAIAQNNFYDIDSVQKIEITFTQANWDYQMDTAKSGSEGYIVAVQCLVNGVAYDSVGVKYKGNSSYSANQTKNPLHIKLDYINDNQDYQGYSSIKLSNGRSDPSMVREMLSYEIARNYMNAPLSNSAEVYINGTYFGLYTNCQSITKSFLGDHFYSNDNAFFKCNPASIMGGVSPDLKYNGASPNSYYNGYELQSDSLSDWYQLINLCDTLNNNFSAIENILDIDRAIWMLAFDNVLVNLDSYLGGFRQNYYLYRDDNNRFCSIVWDLNMSFGGFSQLSGMSSLDSTGMKNLSPSANSTSTNHPLVKKIWTNATYQRMFIAHMKTITQEMFSSGLYSTRAQYMQSVISASVYNDIYKFYTNAQFNSSLTTNIGGGLGGSTVPGIVNLMTGRVNYLNNTTYFTNTAPSISSISLSNPTPAVFTSVYVTSAISSPTYAYVGYRSQHPSKFIKIQLMDDGLNGDGTAGDGTYGASIPLNSALTEYYIYAENAQAGLFAPQRAEHEFYSIVASVPAHIIAEVVVNEFLPENNSGTIDPNGQHEDWVELHNNTANPISLKGMFLSDNISNTYKWKFPDWATIPANDYLIVWCDEDNGQSGFHANFKFADSGEAVLLNDTLVGILDSITFGFSSADLTFARCPNGTGNYQPNTVATFNAFNTCLTSVEETSIDNPVSIYPNPNNGLFTIQAQGKMEIYNSMGEHILVKELTDDKTSVNLNPFSKGIYLVKVTSEGKTNSQIVIIQ